MAISAYFCEKDLLAIIATCIYFYQLSLNAHVVSCSG